MELDQAATSSLVRGLQHRVEKLNLGYSGRVRLHLQTLMEYDGKGRCGEVRCFPDTADTEIKAWSARVNWSVTDKGYNFVMKRFDGLNASLSSSDDDDD